MAKRVKKVKEDVGYVASLLNINYTIPKGLAAMLAKLSDKSEKEVWCILSELANVCAHRLSNREDNYGSSWTEKVFPGTEALLRINMSKRRRYNHNTKTYDEKATYSAEIKFKGSKDETFTQAQVNDYITESILLGDDEEAIDVTENSESV